MSVQIQKGVKRLNGNLVEYVPNQEVNVLRYLEKRFFSKYKQTVEIKFGKKQAISVVATCFNAMQFWQEACETMK